jgi:hypothetical protein
MIQSWSLTSNLRQPVITNLSQVEAKPMLVIQIMLFVIMLVLLVGFGITAVLLYDIREPVYPLDAC